MLMFKKFYQKSIDNLFKFCKDPSALKEDIS